MSGVVLRPVVAVRVPGLLLTQSRFRALHVAPRNVFMIASVFISIAMRATPSPRQPRILAWLDSWYSRCVVRARSSRFQSVSMPHMIVSQRVSRYPKTKSRLLSDS